MLEQSDRDGDKDIFNIDASPYVPCHIVQSISLDSFYTASM